MKHVIITICIIISNTLFSQENYNIQDISINQHIDGTLLLPNEMETYPLAIIVAGAGPTDRNGNQNFMQNNSLKKLAEGLSNNGIATFRYDKRIVKQIRQGNVSSNIMFDDFVTDAISTLKFFKSKTNFSSIYIIGHSQGSLVGMLCAKEGVSGFISLAGAGKPIDEVILDQINATAPMFNEDAKKAFNIIRSGETTTDFPLALSSIFSIDIQPFMSNWMQYNPQSIIQTLEIPVLIINGTKDIQVSTDEADLLHIAKKDSQLVIINNMNHILVPIDGDRLENSKSYNEPHRTLSVELIDKITSFIKQ
ncbi:alpha/beta hydrolase [Pontimicrobium sp. IMCC45349]|uniref:alpha/beta hydrolase n=1 Tax=Pontimicrobium sp. IMCC45349 TaxID=3391574 RepID=UPI0039A27639